MNMPRAVLLGGSGFIGQHLVRALRGKAETVVYDLREPPFEKPDLYLAGDMDDIQKIAGVIKSGDKVFHLVHSTIPSESNQAPGEDLSLNLFRFIRLLEMLADRGIDRLIYSSSGGTVYGEPEEIPIPESSALRPVSGYGIVKMLMERYLRIFGLWRKLDYLIVRISNPYGPCQELSNRHGAVPALMRALRSSKPFGIFGDGETVRDYIYIEDVCSALAGLAVSEERNRAFNIGTGEGTSLNRLISEIERVSGLKLDRIHEPIRGSDLRRNVLAVSGINKATGWKPETTLEQGLRKTWEYWCQIEKP